MSKERLFSPVHRAASTCWKWISRRPDWFVFAVALGAGMMAWFADHSVGSVVGSALIAGSLAHLAGQKFGVPVTVSLLIQSLISIFWGDKSSGLNRPFGVKFWLWLLLALPVLACGLGIFFGGAMLVGTLTERALDEPGKEN